MTTTTERSAPVLRPPARRPVATIALIVGAAVALLLVVVLLGAWALDTALGGDQAQRNVYVAGHDVGGKSEATLAPVLDDVGQEIAATRVHLELPDTTLDSTAADLGLAARPGAHGRRAPWPWGTTTRCRCGRSPG